MFACAAAVGNLHTAPRVQHKGISCGGLRVVSQPFCLIFKVLLCIFVHAMVRELSAREKVSDGGCIGGCYRFQLRDGLPGTRNVCNGIGKPLIIQR